MGNGSISRPENLNGMHVSPSAPSEFIVSRQRGVNNGYAANNGTFDHYYHPAGSSGSRMDTIRSQSNGYDSHANHLNYGQNDYWTNGSNSVAPTSYSRSHYGKDPYGKNLHESSHQSPLSMHRKPKKENMVKGHMEGIIIMEMVTRIRDLTKTGRSMKMEILTLMKLFSKYFIV